MTKIYWNPIPQDALSGTIWEKLSNDRFIEIDAKHFELQFQVRPSKPLTARQSVAGSLSTDHNKRTVSKKRSQHILSVLNVLNLSHDQIRSAMLEMDEEVLSTDKLADLMAIVPNVEEQRRWEHIESTKSSSTKTAELFLHSMHDFHALDDRLKMWMFARNFNEVCDSMMAQYHAILRACNAISSNQGLRLLLQIVLALGNRLNSSSSTKVCHGHLDLS